MREVVNASGTVVAQYDYDPYGRRETVSETVAFDWGFTGHYYHADSGLHLAPFRAYDADLGRWLSRDPLGEAGGINLYEYALSNPVNFVDPLGLSPGWDFFGGVADGLTFGLSTWAFGSSFNQCSRAFSAGVWAGFGASLVLTGGAGGVGFFAARALLRGGLRKLAGVASRRTGNALVRMQDDLYARGSVRNVAGYEIWGNAGRVGNTYNVNVLGLFKKEGALGLKSLAGALKSEAAAAGATRLSITGHAIVNKALQNLTPRAAQRLGFQLERINADTIILRAAIP